MAFLKKSIVDTSSLVPLFLEDEELQMHPYVLRSKSGQHFKDRLRDSILSNLRLTVTADFVQNAWKSFNIPGTTPKDYLYRLIPLSQHRWIITSIRFRRGNPNKPFIEIVNKTFPITHKKDLDEIAELVTSSYKVFQPTLMRIYDPSSGTALPAPSYLIENDFRFYGATISDLLGNTSPILRKEDSLQLAHPQNMDFYASYCGIYERLSRSENLYGPEGVWIESKDKLEIAKREKRLFMIVIEGEWAGVIAFRERADRFFSGICLIEWVLNEKFRRKGFAPMLLKKTAKLLQADNDELVYAHIMDQNHWAVSAAVRAGLRVIGGYTFIRL